MDIQKIAKESHIHSEKKLLKEADSDLKKGLTEEEVQRRLKEFGENKLKEKDKRSIAEILLDQILNPVIYLLTGAAVLAFVFGDMAEGVAIVVVLLLNTLIGFWMEYQAEKSMDALKEMDKVRVKVRRSGKDQTIDANEIVPGDIILLSSGDVIPADARLIEESELQVDESPLTGESVPVHKDPDVLEKDTPVADRINMLYKGTAVTSGSGTALVVATGMETELGGISAMVSGESKEDIPLNRKLNTLSKRLIWVTLGLALLFFIFGYIAGKETYTLIQTAIAWTIAAIPEGLPIVASIALARGMLRLSKKNVIVKKLAAVETLGETTVIATDKTGTLTHNELTVSKLLLPEEEHLTISWKDNNQAAIENDITNSNAFDHLLRVAVWANDAEREERGGEDFEATGDPLEIALLRYVKAIDAEKFERFSGSEQAGHLPFNSDRMVMGTAYRVEEEIYVAGKGAADALIPRCNRVLTSDNNKKLTDEDQEYWLKMNDEMSADGLKVLAFACGSLKDAPEEEEDFLHELCLIGLVGFIDPPRKEVSAAMEQCHKAGIRVVMITGDHPETARKVGEEVHLSSEEKKADVLTGTDLNKRNREELKNDIAHISIFSRVDPGDKLELIKALQENGEIVAMTGDGVNDAPALKKANVGIAMGKRGTQVAQEVADIVLKDDKFDSILQAIRQGRIIFGNIRKFIIYQLSYHLGEILIIGTISFTFFTLPLLPLQLLFLNLLSDVFPALALGIGKGRDEIMAQPPKDPQEPIITRHNWIQIGVYGLVFTLCISGSYWYAKDSWGYDETQLNNIAFFSLAFAQLLHVFNMRDPDESFWNNQVTRNKYVWYAVVLCAVVLLSAYFIPALAKVFSFVSLSVSAWVLITLTAFAPVVIIQILKVIDKRL
ncbi:cation-translocating P-type ATPase [Robertkochia aurantiaca]|uniref:cation-translocating P-type ATPase n=1 Tax=Robertkochia aurantiaca TaxID=2873700 RepID=UPI001CCE0E9C|nr:cation-transporting P-type ATPase [Robertkochia sp. 3YJGBD-33]